MVGKKKYPPPKDVQLVKKKRKAFCTPFLMFKIRLKKRLKH